MADEDKKPTEEQVKAHNEAQEAKWQGDYKEEDLNIPYKREAAAEDTADKKDEKLVAEEKNEEEPEQTEEYSEPEPVLTVKDPGEYQPADYSFEVALKGGKSVKINTPEEADKLAEDPENFETPKQLLDFINKTQTMRNKLDKDHEKWETEHTTFAQQLEQETQRRGNIEQFVSEFNYLIGKGLLPPVAKEYRDADWTDPEVAKQSGVKEQRALLDYFVKENKVRSVAKIKPLTSMVDAFNAWQQDEGRQKSEAKVKADAEAKKAAGEARKAAGSRIAGVSSSQQGAYVPKGIAVGNPHVFDRGAAQWDD